MDEPWKERCRPVVQDELKKHGWELVTDWDGFIEEISEDVHSQGTVKAGREQSRIKRATMRAYCPILYAACGEADSPRRNRAFHELWVYLYPIALAKTREPELAEEVAQQALESTYGSLDRVEDPRRFLGYAKQILVHVISDRLEALEKEREVSLPFESASPTDDSEHEEAGEILTSTASNETPMDSGKSGIDRMLDQEFRRELLDVVQACVKQLLQQIVLIDLLLQNMERQEIAESLGLEVNYVDQLRYRGLKSLRDCNRFDQFDREHGLRERVHRLPPVTQQFVRAVLNRPNDELSHAECSKTFPAAVDAVIDGFRLADKFPAVKRHIDACDICAKEYAELLDIALREEAGQIHIPDTIPDPDLSFLRNVATKPATTPAPGQAFLPGPNRLWERIWKHAKQKAATIVAALVPGMVPDFPEIANVLYKQVEKSGTQFRLSPVTMRRPDQDLAQVNQALAVLAVTYRATDAIVRSLTLEHMDSLVAQNALCAWVEQQAKVAVVQTGVESEFGWKIAKEFAQQLCSDPESLRQLIQELKQ